VRFIIITILAVVLMSSNTANAIVGITLCLPDKPVTQNQVWTVAPRAAGVRKVRYLRGGQNGHNVIMTVPVGSTCYDDTRPREDCINPKNCKGKTGDRRWRLWREGGKQDGRAIGEIKCVLSVTKPVAEPPPEQQPVTVSPGWVVAPNRGVGSRPVRSLTGEVQKEVARAPKGDLCGAPSRELQTGKRQWRLWPVSGDPVGEVYCEARDNP